MENRIIGIHHVTAICGAAQQNVDFYAGFLGLRLVKRTVNFDDPGTYHLYYGDELGRPGSIMTFFPWPDAVQGKSGPGAAAAATFAIPAGSGEYWIGRFADEDWPFDAPYSRFGQQVISFRDPDGLSLELIEEPDLLAEDGSSTGWSCPIPSSYAIRHFHSVTLWSRDLDATARLLTETFGYEPAGVEGERMRFGSPDGQGAHVIDLEPPAPNALGRQGKGTMHHVAFRAKNKEDQLYWREQLISLGFSPTAVVDRQYFHSIYFREPGGVLFEIATDPPGFTRDEAPDKLGSGLKLPEWYEARRRTIEQRLPELRVPNASVSVGRP